MKRYFGYIRVSTAKQGAQGVSLVEQKAAIERYAARSSLGICEWFEERETAAKRGRPVFTRMLAQLRKGTAHGVVIHKIDRSARNLKDWADLGDLIDAGVEVHFAADALDLNSRGGRLSADIQAVVAADYIRNLREETKKGFYGRLKQGLYPLPAPLGYLDCGGGKPKALDPKTAPLVRQAFELYASGAYSLRSLLTELNRLGLRNQKNGVLSVNGVASLLSNPFYCGLIRLRKSGDLFRGAHQPVISVALFERVQRVLKGKLARRTQRHVWPFRRMIRCGLCGLSLIGERQKGTVYYRCHTKGCPTTTVRDDVVDAKLRNLYVHMQLAPEEAREARSYLEARLQNADEDREALRAGLRLQLADVKARMERLTDALLDGLLDCAAFEERRATLVLDAARIEERLRGDVEEDSAGAERFLELAESVSSSYDSADTEEKRRIVEITTSNFSLSRNELTIAPSEPFLTLANRMVVTTGGPNRDKHRDQGMCPPRRKEVVRAFVDRLFSIDANALRLRNSGEPKQDVLAFPKRARRTDSRES